MFFGLVGGCRNASVENGRFDDFLFGLMEVATLTFINLHLLIGSNPLVALVLVS